MGTSSKHSLKTYITCGIPGIPKHSGNVGNVQTFPGIPWPWERPMLRDSLIESWIAGRSSPEVYAEVAYAFALGHRAGQTSPIQPGEFIPSTAPKRAATPKPVTGRLPQHLIDQAKAVDILEIAGRLLGEPVQQRGSEEFLTTCPGHDDESPSLNLNPRKQAYFCFVCQQGGDSISLVMTTLACNFREAVSWLLGAPPHHPSGQKEGRRRRS